MNTEEKATAIETHAYQFNVVKSIKDMSWWQKALVSTVFGASVLTLSGFIYKNAGFPAQEKEINEIKLQLTKVIQYQSNDITDKAVQKEKQKTFEINLTELKTDMKDGFKEIKDMIRANTMVVKQIDKNTK